jgi:hypothetical protein
MAFLEVYVQEGLAIIAKDEIRLRIQAIYELAAAATAVREAE